MNSFRYILSGTNIASTSGVRGQLYEIKTSEVGVVSGDNGILENFRTGSQDRTTHATWRSHSGAFYCLRPEISVVCVASSRESTSKLPWRLPEQEVQMMK